MKLNEYNTSTSIYLQQIEVYLNTGEGYSQIRKHLFRDLNILYAEDGSGISQYQIDQKLAENIIDSLTTSLNAIIDRAERTFRIVQIIQDLLTYAEEPISEAMHQKPFVDALLNNALAIKFMTYHAPQNHQNKLRLRSIFKFWYQRNRENPLKYQLFFNGYKEILQRKLPFSQKMWINPNNSFKVDRNFKEDKSNKKQEAVINHIAISLQQIEQFTRQTQHLMKENIIKIANTEYVRLIKHKSKILYSYSTEPQKYPNLTAKQKQKIKVLYGKLRLIQKQIAKFNQNKIEVKKVNEEEKVYMGIKMEHISPKKSEEKAAQSSKKIEQMNLLQIPGLNPSEVIADQKENNENNLSNSQPYSNSKEQDLLELSPSKRKAISDQNTNRMKPMKKVQAKESDDLLALNQKLQNQEEFEDYVQPEETVQPEEQSKDKLCSQKEELFEIFENATSKKLVKEISSEPTFENVIKKQEENTYNNYIIDTTHFNENKGFIDAAKQQSPSKKSSKSDDYEFDNKSHKKNPYQQIIKESLDKSESNSSHHSVNEENTESGFNIFGMKIDFGFGNRQAIKQNKQIFEKEEKYDEVKYHTPKKGKESENQKQKQKVQLVDVIYSEGKKPKASSSQKVIAAVDYTKYLQKQLSSHSSPGEEEQKKIVLAKQSPHKELPELNLAEDLNKSAFNPLKILTKYEEIADENDDD